jgi:TRAP-type C4-dicarboxylate transport system permease small subunit
MMERFDNAVARIERVLLLVCVAAMTIFVGVDVVQRTFSRPVGKIDGIMLQLFGGDAAANTRALEVLSPVVQWLLALGLAVGASLSAAAFTHKRTGVRSSTSASVGRGVLLLMVSWVAVKVLLWVFPSSVPDAQKLALGLMLWSGMLGASLAVKQRRHIVLDAAVKKATPLNRKRLALAGGVLSALVCGAVAGLAWMELAGQIHEWKSADGVGLFPSLPIPMWSVTLAIPLCFSVMTMRFLRVGIHDFEHGPPTAEDLGVDDEALKQGQEQLQAEVVS